MSKTIVIEISGGCLTNVSNLPEGWSYNLLDWDSIADGVKNATRCQSCMGTGIVGRNDTCYVCEGSGFVSEDDEIEETCPKCKSHHVINLEWNMCVCKDCDTQYVKE